MKQEYNDLLYDLARRGPDQDNLPKKRDDYKNLKEQLKKDLFPAVHLEFEKMLELSDSFWPNAFRQFGYGLFEDGSKFILQIPDIKVIEHRWKSYFGTEADFPLKIEHDPGIASDETFIKSFLENKIILSSGKEMIHDFTTHLLPQLFWAFTTGKDKGVEHIFNTKKRREFNSNEK